MNKSSYLLVLLVFPLAAFAAKATHSWPVTGVVTEECAVAVSCHPILYSAATQGREDALKRELRVRDSKGRDVPYALRAAKTRVVEEVKEWRELKVTRVSETDGRLVVEAEFPENVSRPERFLALKVATPLTDFEQSVEVSSEDVPLASGVLCDYRRFADLRVTEMPLEASFRRTLTVAFSKPTSEAAAAAFERTIRENGEGKLEAKSVRESVVNRPFRIDSLSVAVPKTRVSFESAPPMVVSTACTVETDAKAKKTVLETSTFGLPATAIAINATDRNFSRKVAVFRRMDARWHPLATGRISAVNLPGEKKSSLEIAFGREVRETALRIEIENDDNPPLTLATTSDAGAEGFPVTLKVTPYDIVLVAAPGEKYSLVVEPGADRLRYDEAILGYIDRVQDPVRFEISGNTGGGDPYGIIIGGEDGPTAVWLTTPGVIPAVSVVVFVILGIVCIRLVKSSKTLGLAAAVSLALSADAAAVSTRTGIEYAERPGCVLDVQYPEATTGFPTVVWFHGGGLTSGSRYFAQFGDSKIAQVAAGYRLLGKDAKTGADCIEDAAAAVAWTLKHIAEYGGDPKKVFVGGMSAGAYLSMMVGMAPEYLARHGIRNADLAGIAAISGQATKHFNVRKFSGDTDPQFVPKIDSLAPLAHVSADLPPILCICGQPPYEWKCRSEENRLLIASCAALGHKNAKFVQLDYCDHGRVHNAALPYVVMFVRGRLDNL